MKNKKYQKKKANLESSENTTILMDSLIDGLHSGIRKIAGCNVYKPLPSFDNPLGLENHVDTSKITIVDWENEGIMSPDEVTMNAIVEPIKKFIDDWVCGDKTKAGLVNQPPRTGKSHAQKTSKYIPQFIYSSGIRYLIQITPTADLRNDVAYCPENVLELFEIVSNGDSDMEKFAVVNLSQNKIDSNSSRTSPQYGGNVSYQLDQFRSRIREDICGGQKNLIVFTMTQKAFVDFEKLVYEEGVRAKNAGHGQDFIDNITNNMLILCDEADYGAGTPDLISKARGKAIGYSATTNGSIMKAFLRCLHRRPQVSENQTASDCIIPTHERVHDGIRLVLMSGSCSVAQLAEEGNYKNPVDGDTGDYHFGNTGYCELLRPEGCPPDNHGMIDKKHLVNKQAALNKNCIIQVDAKFEEETFSNNVEIIIRKTAEYEVEVRERFGKISPLFQPKFVTVVQCANDHPHPKSQPHGSLRRGHDDVPTAGISLYNTVEESGDWSKRMYDDGLLEALNINLASDFTAVYVNAEDDKRYNQKKNEYGFHLRDVRGEPRTKYSKSNDRNHILESLDDPFSSVRLCLYQDMLSRGVTIPTAYNFVCGRGYKPEDFPKAVSGYIQGPGRVITQKVMFDWDKTTKSFAIQWRYGNNLELMVSRIEEDYGIPVNVFIEYIKVTNHSNVFLLSRPEYKKASPFNIDYNPASKGLNDFADLMVNGIADQHSYYDYLLEKYPSQLEKCPHCNGTGFVHTHL